MATPLYPSLPLPNVDPSWFDPDAAIDEEAELVQLEKEHKQWQEDITNRDNDAPIAGQPGHDERFEEADDEEDDGDDGDGEEESDSNEEEDEDDEGEIEMG